MVLEIPVVIDETNLEEKIAEDAIKKASDKLYNDVLDTIKSRHSYYKKTDMTYFIEEIVSDKFSTEYKDEIISEASRILAEKLARSKKGKAILEESE